MVNDSAARYGLISRFFHWLMALGFVWMLVSASARFIDKEAAFTKAVFAYHGQVGFTILWLAVLRVIWAIIQRPNRPKNPFAVKLGHACMYVLMIAVPAIAVIRMIGMGRGFTYWGLWPILEKTGVETAWMKELGNTFHGNLGWLLFALIIGHIFFAFKHSHSPTDQKVLPRMLGKTL